MTRDDSVEALPNIGPKLGAKLRAVGVSSAKELLAKGDAEVFSLLAAAFPEEACAHTRLALAVEFYEALGFTLKFRLSRPEIALFSIGAEAPGLMLRTEAQVAPGRFWVEVEDADSAVAAVGLPHVASKRLTTATGVTCEVTDPWGNVVGFADYRHRRDLARP